jgi:hypothetical protein
MECHRATHPILIGRLMKHFAHLTNADLEIGPGEDLVVGDDV